MRVLLWSARRRRTHQSCWGRLKGFWDLEKIETRRGKAWDMYREFGNLENECFMSLKIFIFFFFHATSLATIEEILNISENQQWRGRKFYIRLSSFNFSSSRRPFQRNNEQRRIFVFESFPPLQTYLGCRLRFFLLWTHNTFASLSFLGTLNNVWGGIFWLLKIQREEVFSELFFLLPHKLIFAIIIIIIISTNNCNASKMLNTRVESLGWRKIICQIPSETEVPSSTFHPAQLSTTFFEHSGNLLTSLINYFVTFFSRFEISEKLFARVGKWWSIEVEMKTMLMKRKSKFLCLCCIFWQCWGICQYLTFLLCLVRCFSTFQSLQSLRFEGAKMSGKCVRRDDKVFI